MDRTTRRTRLALVGGVVVVLAIVGAAAVLATTGDPVNPFGQGEPETGELAPGVYANDSVNVTRLLVAHRSQLREQGFLTETTVTSRANDSVVVASGQQVRATSNLSRVVVQQHRSAAGRQNVTADVYVNETNTLVRMEADGNESYQVRERVQSQSVPPISRATLTVFGEAARTFTVENTTGTDAQRRTTLTATIGGNGTTPQTDVTMIVDEQGVIRSLTIVSGQQGSGQVVETRYDLQQLGVNTVQPPDWLSEIPANATVRTPPAGPRPTTR
ncbi:hypothetical protein ACFR9U_17325 [Halorientalis brevis]|uniref:Outer membrane lipoprotein-sorting protein n=1 Tax=Halorientalis brevis TaxID=1126241 RepID=A0ABD6CH44_9EURY|nr:hypothetical protein [Halorientalis brevis]